MDVSTQLFICCLIIGFVFLIGTLFYFLGQDSEFKKARMNHNYKDFCYYLLSKYYSKYDELEYYEIYQLIKNDYSEYLERNKKIDEERVRKLLKDSEFKDMFE